MLTFFTCSSPGGKTNPCVLSLDCESSGMFSVRLFGIQNVFFFVGIIF